jgi:hypothetical protein
MFDNVFDGLTKEDCTRRNGRKDVHSGYEAASVRCMRPDVERPSPRRSPGVRALVDAADAISAVLQYKTSGFAKNARQHRQFGLAAVEVAQVRVGRVSIVHTCLCCCPMDGGPCPVVVGLGVDCLCRVSMCACICLRQCPHPLFLCLCLCATRYFGCYPHACAWRAAYASLPLSVSHCMYPSPSLVTLLCNAPATVGQTLRRCLAAGGELDVLDSTSSWKAQSARSSKASHTCTAVVADKPPHVDASSVPCRQDVNAQVHVARPV